MTTATTGQLKVRLQPPIREWVKAQADAQERSMTWLINKVLAQAKAAQEAANAQPA